MQIRQSRGSWFVCPHAASLVVLLGVSLPASESRASMIMQAYTHGNMGAAVVSNAIITGYEFTTNDDIFVERLGVSIPFPTLPQPDIVVGIWSVADETLLASATIPGGTSLPIEGGSRFVDIDQIRLDTGEAYRIAMFIPPGDDGRYNLGGNREESPVINFGTGFFHPNASSVAYPRFNPNQIRISGPNFQFTIVPAPGAFALIAIAGFTGVRRRR